MITSPTIIKQIQTYKLPNQGLTPHRQAHWQAPVAKKKATKPAKEGDGDDKSKPVTPETPQEKVLSRMDDFLKSAAVARTKSLTPGGLEYAEDLSKKVLAHAISIEGIYKKIQGAVKSKASPKTFLGFLSEMDETDATSAKFKAGLV